MEEEWEQVDKQTKNTIGYVRSELVACLTFTRKKHVCTRSSTWPLIVSNDCICCFDVQEPRGTKQPPAYARKGSACQKSRSES